MICPRPATLALLLCAPALSAQAAVRSTAAGQVLDRDGKGVSGAVVRFMHRPIPWFAGYGEADVVDATTDGSGRFRLDLLPRRPYSAFATWQVDGAPRVTEVGEACIAGVFTSLREQARAIAPRVVRVEGLDAWAAEGPLAFRAVPGTRHQQLIALTRREDGAVVLPTLPRTSAVFEVVTAGGDTLWASWLSFAPGDNQAPQVPPPLQVPIEVVDGSSGKPIAGAIVKHRSGWLSYASDLNLDAADYSCDRWREVARTDARGLATARVPGAEDPWTSNGSPPARLHLVFAIEAPGCATQIAGWNGGGAFFDQTQQRENPKPLRVPMRPAEPVLGRLTLDGKRPAAGLDVLLFMQARCYEDKHGWASWPAPVQVGKTDGDGRFEFAGAGLGRGPILVGVPLAQPALAELCRAHLAPMTQLAVPFAVAGTKGNSGNQPLARNLGEESLGFERAVTLRMLAPGGMPAQGVRVGLVPADAAFDALSQEVVTDAAGRCELLLPPNDCVLWSVSKEHGYLLQRLPSRSTASREDLPLTLLPFRYAHGRVSAGGTPVAGASLREGGMRSNAPQTGDPLLDNAASRVNQWINHAVTDGEGRFRMPFLPVRGATIVVQVNGSRAGSQLRGSLLLPIDPDTEPTPLEVALEK